MSYHIQNLTSFVTYEVKVRAYNSKFGIEDNIIITTDELGKNLIENGGKFFRLIT